MNRRTFLAASALAALATRTSWAQAETKAYNPNFRENDDWQKPLRALRGVNLGNWLVLEKWMGDAPFVGTDAKDEYTLSLLPDGRERLEKHRSTWISEADFEWIKSHGLDAVRLPVGYWVLGDDKPYHGGKKHLDNAFLWAKNQGLQVLLDLHGAPGSQNGQDHSGKSGPIEWTLPENQAKTLRVLEALAREYGNHSQLWGLQLMNEPLWSVPLDALQKFGLLAYSRLRPLLPASVAFVYHDGFRPFDWGDHLSGDGFQNVVRDTHPYQVFTDEDKRRPAVEQLRLALHRRDEITRMAAGKQWIIIGEWSLALSGESPRGNTLAEVNALRRAYVNAQLWSFEGAHGWFYWSYKTQGGGDWSYRDCVERGFLPSRFD